MKFSGSSAQFAKRSSRHKRKRALWDALRRERNPISTMKSYHKQIILDILIGLIGGLLMVTMIIGASIQHADRIEALAAVEVGE